MQSLFGQKGTFVRYIIEACRPSISRFSRAAAFSASNTIERERCSVETLPCTAEQALAKEFTDLL